MLTERLLQVTLLGTEWVLYLLMALSVVSVALMVERAILFWNLGRGWQRLAERLDPLIHAGDLDGVREVLRVWRGIEADVPRACVDALPRGIATAERETRAALMTWQQRLDRRMAFLGTLGNNAPFLGLFGTVLGIIRAFHDLSLDAKGGANVVMAGISEALVATAAGLFVAIPAVIAFNAFQRQISRNVTRSEALTERLMAQASPRPSRSGAASPSEGSQQSIS